MWVPGGIGHVSTNLLAGRLGYQGVVGPAESLFVCQECGKYYDKRHSYKMHIKRYHTNPALLCNICSKRFFSRHDLQRHVVTHTGIRPFTCDICGSKMYTLTTLKSHVKHKHGHPFLYFCKHCGKGYNDSSAWVAHEMSHHNQEIGLSDQNI
ncbi:putative transcription factor Ovo-like 1 [Haliotis asinina]|uniref:putative transcription factor Ovo-like 1 n=1 Tax=Haliotis asinina TaxID=109174 RepID=UPI003531F2C3